MRIPPRTARYTFGLQSALAQLGDDDIAKRVSPNLDDVPLDCTHWQFDQYRLLVSSMCTNLGYLPIGLIIFGLRAIHLTPIARPPRSFRSPSTCLPHQHHLGV